MTDNPFANHWTKYLEVGQVVRSRGGVLRIVRAVARKRSAWGQTAHYGFIIQHCSWTTRGYTYLSDNDLRQGGYERVWGRISLNTAFDKAILADMKRSGGANECEFHCCDVKGLG